MEPNTQHSEKGLRTANRILEIVEFALTAIVVGVLMVSIFIVIDWVNVEESVVKPMHTIGYVCFGLRCSIFGYLYVSAFLNDKFRHLYGIIGVVTFGNVLRYMEVSDSGICFQGDKIYDCQPLLATDDPFNLARLAVAMGYTNDYFARRHYYQELTGKRQGLTKTMNNGVGLIASATVIPLKSLKNFNSGSLPITIDDIDPGKSNVAYLYDMAIDHNYIESTIVNAWLCMVCDHIASVLCTKDGTFTDIVIYTRVSNEQVVFPKILRKMGFVQLVKTDQDKVYALKFSEQAGNVFVQQIYYAMQRYGHNPMTSYAKAGYGKLIDF